MATKTKAKAKATGTEKATGKIANAALDLDKMPNIITLQLGEQSITGEFRDFKSGSKGWYLGGKVFVAGAKCQMSCSITIIGTKPAKKEKK